MKHAKRGNKPRSLSNIKIVFQLKRPLELFHIDLFGPSRTISLGGNLYTLVIIDDFSRFQMILIVFFKDFSRSYKFKIFLKLFLFELIIERKFWKV